MQREFDEEIGSQIDNIQRDIAAKRLGCQRAMAAAETWRVAAREEAEILRRAGGASPPTPGLNRSGESGAGSLAGTQKLRLAKMEPPRFSGDMKDYPTFRED